MTKASAVAKLVVIDGGLAQPSLLPRSPKKLLAAERYLARQARNAHHLGIRSLEHYYNVAYLALRVWRMGCLESEAAKNRTKELTS